MRLRLTSPLAAAALIAVVAAFSAPASAGQGPVAVFPAAGCPVASPTTQISFRGVSAGELSGVEVRGSSSGRHAGRLEAHSDGRGASFVPKRPFRPGETVRVSANVPLVGARKGVVSFRIASPPGHYRLDTPADPGGNPKGAQHFRSRPGLQPPSTPVTKLDRSARGEGDIFLAPKAGPGQNGPQIVDQHGRLVWFKRVGRGRSVFDFRSQSYRGAPVLTWWEGKAQSGESAGVGHIVDSSYRPIATVHAGNGYHADLHEFEISRSDTALVLAYQPVTYHGETEMDTLMQEIDVPTGLVMFEWHSLGQIPRSRSLVKYGHGKPFDVAHLNSIQKEPDGNFLVSARNTSAIYKLDHVTGRIVWQLGGKGSDFKMSGGSQFTGQHHVRLQPDGSITVFDNGSPPHTNREARALWLNVDEQHRRVTVRHSYRYPRPIHSTSQGSVQLMPGGHVFVGWGGDYPYFSEFARGGRIILDGHFDPKGDDSYRAFRFPWTGRPTTRPDVAADDAAGTTRVYASWNGATEVARWQVVAGPAAAAALMPVKDAPRTGFETRIELPSAEPYVAVRALDSHGHVLGTSRTISPTSRADH